MQAFREHEFCYGHRVAGHESKCANLHGHNGRVIFYIEGPALDTVGRVLDFSVMKSTLVQWLEDNWDHKMLFWDKDVIGKNIHNFCVGMGGIILVPFNPTAENMAQYLVDVVGPKVLPEHIRLVKVEFYETAKCGVVYEL